MTSSSEAAMTQPDESRTISSRGKKTKILAGSDEIGGAFALVEAVYPPGYVGPPRKFHSDRITALYVVEGEMTIEVDNRVNKAAKGDFFLVPRGTTYHHSNSGTQPARVLFLYSPGGPDKYLLELAEVARKHGYPPPTRYHEALRREVRYRPRWTSADGCLIVTPTATSILFEAHLLT